MRCEARAARSLTARAVLFPGDAEDRLGIHLLECRAYEIAERCFREAMSRNPSEQHFKVHLAHSFYQQRRYREAVDVLHGVLHMAPGFSPATRLLERCAARLGDPPGAVGRP